MLLYCTDHSQYCLFPQGDMRTCHGYLNRIFHTFIYKRYICSSGINTQLPAVQVGKNIPRILFVPGPPALYVSPLNKVKRISLTIKMKFIWTISPTIFVSDTEQQNIVEHHWTWLFRLWVRDDLVVLSPENIVFPEIIIVQKTVSVFFRHKVTRACPSPAIGKIQHLDLWPRLFGKIEHGRSTVIHVNTFLGYCVSENSGIDISAIRHIISGIQFFPVCDSHARIVQSVNDIDPSAYKSFNSIFFIRRIVAVTYTYTALHK